ncbi:hypothetical protein [Burkholderia territorii]|nr:hypothetical protein [Burkholderia territorii]MBM2773571.1 hypothetical protein [Burkholderia territorii]
MHYVYGLPVPDDLDAEIERLIDAFLHGTPAAPKQHGSDATARRRRRT